MRKRIIKKRSIKRKFKKIREALTEILSIPFVRPALFISAAICLLLIIAPYFLTKFLPQPDHGDGGKTPAKADFDLAETPDTIDVYRCQTKRVETIDFEDYVKGVVSGEMPSDFHMEALKAQSVAARTYSLARVLKAEDSGNPSAHPGAPLCDSTHCQVYRSKDELSALKGDAWMKDGWKKVSKAVDDTKGELLYYNGELVQQALFHSSSGGKTENSEDVFASAIPYLVSVDSPYEENATHQNEKHSFSIEEFSNKIKSAYPSISFGNITSSNIEIVSHSSGGRVEKMRIGNGILEGRSVREALGLASANFTVKINDNTITFTTNGSGHGVGMSQYGADGMAEKGYDYKDILTHYYSGTEVY